jgi:hypothetical protein
MRSINTPVAIVALLALGTLFSGCDNSEPTMQAAAAAPTVQYPLKVEWKPPVWDTSSWALDPIYASSERELIEFTLSAVKKGSEQNLAKLCFQRREYIEYLYPYLKVSMPVRNTPADFVWKQHWLSAFGGLRKLLRRLQGRELTYVRHEFSSPAQHYGPLTLYRDVKVTVRDERGNEIVIRLFRSLIECKGRFKIFSFPK